VYLKVIFYAKIATDLVYEYIYRHSSVVKEVTKSVTNKAVCYYQTVHVQQTSVCAVQIYK